MKTIQLVFAMAFVSVFLALTTTSGAESETFKANFSLHAKSATVSDGKLKLSGVSPVVFVVESGSDTAFGVAESATSFLERWNELDHEIRPHGILFTSGEKPIGTYRALRFDIDNPSQTGGEQSTDWVFEIDHVHDAQKAFDEARTIEPVMLTVVMEHTQDEVAKGRVCGPWDVSELRDHHELLAP